MFNDNIVNKTVVLDKRNTIGDSVQVKNKNDSLKGFQRVKDGIKKDYKQPHGFPKAVNDSKNVELNEERTAELLDPKKEQNIPAKHTENVHTTLTGSTQNRNPNFKTKTKVTNLDNSTTVNRTSNIVTVNKQLESFQANKLAANKPSHTESAGINTASSTIEQVETISKQATKITHSPSHVEPIQSNKTLDALSLGESVKHKKVVGAIEPTALIHKTVDNTSSLRESIRTRTVKANKLTKIENPNSTSKKTDSPSSNKEIPRESIKTVKGTKITKIENQNKTIESTTGLKEIPQQSMTFKSTFYESCIRQSQYIRNIKKLPSIGPLSIHNLNDFFKSSKIDFEHLFNEKTIWNYQITDFDLIKTLGIGGFGKVVLGELKKDKTLYALKIIDKKSVVQRSHIKYVSNEKRILQSINFPFVIHLVYFFTDFYYLYLVMPYVPGGNFYRYLKNVQQLKEADARFYIGQIVLALEYLHYLELIHRDVKTENIVIDAFGYLKLVDFGQCIRCYGCDKNSTFTGTPEYMAPEIIEGKGYDCAIDWWSLGVITFEMCAGFRPFKHENSYKLHLLIVCTRYTMPSYFSHSLKLLIQSLLTREPKRRIANLIKKTSEIKKHVWFKGMNWLALLNRNLKAPYLPDIESNEPACGAIKRSSK